MKRFAIVAAATLALLSPMAASSAYADPPGRYDHDNRNDHNDRHDNRNDNRWDQSRHNGYNYNGQWHYGPPPSAYVGRPGFQPGYQAWRRGDRLPSYYRTHYRAVDYRHAHLRAPPRGYHYVQDDRGEYLLVGIATGVIASILLSH